MQIKLLTIFATKTDLIDIEWILLPVITDLLDLLTLCDNKFIMALKIKASEAD